MRKNQSDTIICWVEGEIDRIIHQKWKDSQLHFSVRMLSNNVEAALADIHRDIKTTISYLESVITEECSHRIGKEQASCQDVFDEVINSNIWTVAQSLRKRFPRVVEEESDGSINTRNIQEDLRGRNQKRRRSSTPKRGGLSPSRKIADISDIIQTADRRKERGRQWLYIYTEQRE